MSIFQTIIKNLDTIASKVEHFLAEVEGAAPTIERITASSLLVVGPLLQTIVTMTAGAPTGALVGNVISQIQVKLAAVSQLSATVGTTGSVSDLLAGVSSDLSDLDSIAAIKDPKAQANLALVIKEIDALVAAYAPSPAAAAPAPAAPAAADPSPSPTPAAAAPTPEVAASVSAGPGLHAVVAQ